MGTISAGLLVHRRRAGVHEVLLGHMGGPFWSRKDDAAWSVPKGELDAGEDHMTCAEREFAEELGFPAPAGDRVALGEVRSRDKRLRVWAVEGDVDLGAFAPGTFELEWPPRSGRMQAFPELDRVAFVDLDAARRALVGYQLPLVTRLDEFVRAAPCSPGCA